jgi:hypothetical protein
MKVKGVLLAMLFGLTLQAWGQQPPAPPAGRSQARAEHRQKMMEMHQQEMAAMKIDIEKLNSFLAQMKTNVAAIKDSAEKARWQTNVDMWEVVVNHMDRMQTHMESMGPRMMPYPGSGAPPPSPPAEKKPQ